MRGPVAFPAVDVSRHMAQPWYALAPILASTSSSATVTANAAAHTKGAWTEIVASADSDAGMLVVNVTAVGVASTNTATLLDIGLGASGSEVAVVSNVAVGGASISPAPGGITFVVPVFVRRGQRIAARIQSIVTGGKTATVTIRLGTGEAPWRTPVIVDTIGTSTGNSQGTAMSGTADTYVELTAATTNGYSALVLIPSMATGGTTGGSALYTLGVGPSGSEVVVGHAGANATTQEIIASSNEAGFALFGVDLAPGRRLAVKCSSNASGFQACVLGIRRTV